MNPYQIIHCRIDRIFKMYLKLWFPPKEQTTVNAVVEATGIVQAWVDHKRLNLIF